MEALLMGGAMRLDSTMIQSIVVAIIVFLVQLLFLEFLVLANATMQRSIMAHCDFGSYTTRTLRENDDLSEPGSVVTLAATASPATTCSMPTGSFCLLYTSPSPRD